MFQIKLYMYMRNNNLNKKMKQFFERENYMFFLLNLTQKRSNAFLKSAETKSQELRFWKKSKSENMISAILLCLSKNRLKGTQVHGKKMLFQ